MIDSCSILPEFPPAPIGSEGWPWNEDVKQPPEIMSSGESWPRISIITPSYNQGQFIEQTIRSVLLQGYPNLEYIIIDGGSTDNTVEIIKKYDKWLSYWVSEPDRGQTNAINKGLEKSTGDIFAYINSDDYYYSKDVFYKVTVTFSENRSHNWLVGNCRILKNNELENNVRLHITENPIDWIAKKNYQNRGCSIPQPSTFWRCNIMEYRGLFNEQYNYCMDYEYMVRLGVNGDFPLIIQDTLAVFRVHEESKSESSHLAFNIDNFKIAKTYINKIPLQKRFGVLVRMLKRSTRAKIKLIYLNNAMRNSTKIIKYFKEIFVFPLILFEKQVLGIGAKLFISALKFKKR